MPFLLNKHLISTIAALFLFSITAFSKENIAIHLTPQYPRQGNTLAAEVYGLRPKTILEIQWRRQRYPLYQVNNHFRALIPIAGDVAPGNYLVSLWKKGLLGKTKIKEQPITITAGDFHKENLILEDEKTALTEQPDAQDAKAIIIKTIAKNSKQQFWKGLFKLPVAGRLKSAYGTRRTLGKNQPWSYHKGIDLSASEGTPVLAPNHGFVALTREFPLQGKTIILDHGQGVGTIYMHLSSIEVQINEEVKIGEFLGRVGATGLATGPHLHWGLYVHGESVDPLEWTNREFK